MRQHETITSCLMFYNITHSRVYPAVNPKNQRNGLCTHWKRTLINNINKGWLTCCNNSRNSSFACSEKLKSFGIKASDLKQTFAVTQSNYETSLCHSSRWFLLKIPTSLPFLSKSCLRGDQGCTDSAFSNIAQFNSIHFGRIA